VRDEFRCAECAAHSRPRSRRRAAVPRTYQFNKILGADTFKITMNGVVYNYLNLVCHGTNFQLVVPVGPEGRDHSALEVWKAYKRSWVKYFGPPEMLIVDGGTEFRGDFERRLEQSGTYQWVCDADSPWQNGRVERHGGWIQDLMEKEVDGKFITSPEELELLAAELVANKNRYLHRGGYSPFQLVFGHNPRLPHDLLSDDPLDRIGLEDLRAAPGDADTVVAEFARELEIRKRARQLLFSVDATRKLREATKSAAHQDTKFNQGQWVYVYRRVPRKGPKPNGF